MPKLNNSFDNFVSTSNADSTSSAGINKSKKSTPSRSRNGCVHCRKAKIKCDETKPICINCSKSNRKCDYSIQLVWGGRPYKKPRAEKLNKFSNLPNSQLNSIKTVNTPANNFEFNNISPKQITNTLNPIENLNQLLKIQKKKQQQQQRVPSQPPSPSPPPQQQSLTNLELLEPSKLQPIPSPTTNPIIDTLATFYDQKVTQSLPWSILEEIDQCDLIKEPSLESSGFIVSPSSPFEFDISDPVSSSPHNNLISIPLINEHKQLTDNSSTNSVLIEPIPRGLLPLPDILLNSPHFYEPFQHYVNSTTNLLTPADNTVYINNPFKYVLPKLAMTNDGLMSLIIAFGLAHKSMLSKTDPTELIDSLLSRALSDLLVLLNNKETSTSDLTLTLVIMFSSFLAYGYKSDKWKVHVNGAKQILLMRGYNKPFDKLVTELKEEGNSIGGELKKSKIIYFLIRWFAYIDIFTRLSSPLLPTNEDIVNYLNNDNADAISPISEVSVGSEEFKRSSNISQIDYEVDETNQTLIKDESFNGIDYMMGFDLKLLPIFSQLCDLIKYVNLLKKMNENGKLQLSPTLIENAINIQNKFESLKKTSYIEGIHPLNTIIATNSCFIFMGLIQLYKRVSLMNSDSKLIQSLCVQTLEAFDKYIDSKSQNAVALIFPLFVAGCEIRTSDLEIRQKFIDKLYDLKQNGAVSADCATEVMITCWNTNSNWYDVMKDENRKEVFL
ncbi:hypothetical protein CANINC_004519 [Pichia inconspicua]|uniref:Zn(2)-C6 fungal-type domain-containing protein n=1 Tax=Pichia inconspicua TaxID=52247 RepID=A0A4T0WWP1_9ASCO|nr:hypothetical protein CANINC_004519 [[Candida] inconspicua]